MSLFQCHFDYACLHESYYKLAESKKKIAEVLNNYFIIQSTVDDSNTVLPNYEQPSYPAPESISITEEDVWDAISTFELNKSPGPDHINLTLLKE